MIDIFQILGRPDRQARIYDVLEQMDQNGTPPTRNLISTNYIVFFFFVVSDH